MSGRSVQEILQTTSNTHVIQKLLDERQDLDLFTIKDDRSNNLLHLTAFWNKLPLMKLYLQHQKQLLDRNPAPTNNKDDPNFEINRQKGLFAAWANAENNEGFTPMLYASSVGNVQLIRFLENMGANPLACSTMGLNVIHMAAQGDKIDSLIYFHNKVDIEAVDSKDNMNALHWAAYMGSEKVVEFLLSLDCQLEARTNQDQTALHLAATYGNTKVVRRLLVKGAKRDVVDKKGQTPLMIAQENQYHNISKMLNSNYSIIDHIKFYCNVQIKYEPQDRSLVMPVTFLLTAIFMIGTALAFTSFRSPDHDLIYVASSGIFYLLFAVTYLSLLQAPPPVKNSKSLEQLIGKGKICSSCRIQTKPRSYHCDICKVCVQRYDHHCPWLNSCVGAYNLKRFILFLVLLTLALVHCGAVAVARLANLFNQHLVDRIDVVPSIVVQICSGVNIGVSGVFLLPICSLIYVQVSNTFMNLTTLERYSKKTRSGGSKRQETGTTNGSRRSSALSSVSTESMKDSLLTNSNDDLDEHQCSFRNCINMCCTDYQTDDSDSRVQQ